MSVLAFWVGKSQAHWKLMAIRCKGYLDAYSTFRHLPLTKKKKARAPVAFRQHNKQPPWWIHTKLKAWADWRAVTFAASGQSACRGFLICLPSVYFIACHDWYESFIEIHSAGSQSHRTDVPTETRVRLRRCCMCWMRIYWCERCWECNKPNNGRKGLGLQLQKTCSSAPGFHARGMDLITAWCV